MAAQHTPDKLPDIDVGDTHSPDTKHDLERTTSITQDANGNTVVNREDGEVYIIDRKAERALVWKFDLRISPLLALMYLFNALDKANLGNAKTAGMSCGSPVCRDWKGERSADLLKGLRKILIWRGLTSTTFCCRFSLFRMC